MLITSTTIPVSRYVGTMFGLHGLVDQEKQQQKYVVDWTVKKKKGRKIESILDYIPLVVTCIMMRQKAKHILDTF